METSTYDALSWQGYHKKGIPELRKQLNSAKSSNEMLKIFNKIESKLQENQLGFDCTMMALRLHREGQDPLKILDFGKRALNILLHNENNPALGIQRCSLAIGNLLHLLGSACLELKRYNESLSYLNWAVRNLSKLLLDNFCEKSVLRGLHDTHLVLFSLKVAMGKGDEVVFHAEKVLEIIEKIGVKDCIELGEANRDVANAYIEIGKFEEALPFALKALEICGKHLDRDSREITLLRVSLGSIYTVLGEFDKALEQNRLSISGFWKMGNVFRLLLAEVEGGQMLVDLGRYEEAVEVLKPVISQAETLVVRQDRAESARNEGVRAAAYMAMAKAFCRLDKFANAKKKIKKAQRIFEKISLEPADVATGFMDMAKLYEEMKEYEPAILLVHKALNLPELPQDHFINCYLRLFTLVSLSGTEEKRISSLKEVLEKLKEKTGPKHCYVGYAYAKLGDVYIHLDRPEMAAELYVHAKDILDVSLGPDHMDSLRASQTLSVVYLSMESYDRAIENQEKVVQGFKGLGLSEQDRVNGAVEILNMIKGRDINQVLESRASALQKFGDGEDLPATISKSLFPDDENKVE